MCFILRFFFWIMKKGKIMYSKTKSIVFKFVTYLSYVLLKLNFGLNFVNSALFKFNFFSHNILTFCVLQNDKNETRPKYILLQFYHFTLLKHKFYIIDLAQGVNDKLMTRSSFIIYAIMLLLCS